MGFDSKKIEGTLKQLENAAKGAIRTLNEVTGNEFRDSPLEKEPLAHIGQIATILQNAKEQAAKNVRFEGLSDDEVAATLAAEREAERADLQTLVQEKLTSRQPKAPEPEAEPAPADKPLGDENPPV